MYLTALHRHPAPALHALDRLLNQSFDHFLQAAPSADEMVSPTLDVSESESAYSIQVDLPGLRREDVKVTVSGHQVSLVAQPAKAASEGAAARPLLRERAAARYQRSFRLAQELDSEKSSAQMADGVLTLTLVKRHAAQASTLTIN